jgi:putative transposase
MIEVLYNYRGKGYFLHEFVVMHDHLHLLLTPAQSLEKSVQLIKGGFSYRAKKELEYNWDVWQRGYTDHRIRDAADYDKYARYIHQNPVKSNYCLTAVEYPYSSAHSGYELDAVPQGLKPNFKMVSGAAEAAPLQSIPSQPTNQGKH